MRNKIFSIILVAASFVFGVNSIEICSCDDTACIQRAGTSGLNAVSAQDPICVGEISGAKSGLMYNFTNACLENVRACEISDVYTDFATSVSFFIYCPDLVFTAHAALDGTLFGITPVHGNGKATFQFTGYKFFMDASFDVIAGSDGYDVFELKNEAIDMGAQLHVYDMEGLYEGDPNQKQKSDNLLNIANSMWRLMEVKLQRQILSPFLEKWINKANRYLSFIPAGNICKE